MPDAVFADPRLARIYDALDPDRSDLDVYVALLEHLGARSVLDVGCGTGTFACLLARRGLDVTGVDPAEASLEVARAKPGAAGVRWVHGDISAVPPLQVDAVTMTANVAQVFIEDADWIDTLRRAYACLRPGGHLVFETRDPARQAWLGWHREASLARTDVDGVGAVVTWFDLLRVDGPLVTFRATFEFEADGSRLTSDSTLRFRDRPEIEQALQDVGFVVAAVRDAPDRPGRELVFVARAGGP